MEISVRLRRARKEAGVTQTELSRRTGIKQSVISAYESGVRVPSETSCQRILASLAVRPSMLLERHRETLRATLETYGVTNPRVFGSTAHGRDTERSDVDLLVRFPPGTGLFKLIEIEDAVEEAIGTDVDLVSERSLDLTKPAHQSILEESVPL